MSFITLCAGVVPRCAASDAAGPACFRLSAVNLIRTRLRNYLFRISYPFRFWITEISLNAILSSQRWWRKYEEFATERFDGFQWEPFSWQVFERTLPFLRLLVRSDEELSLHQAPEAVFEHEHLVRPEFFGVLFSFSFLLSATFQKSNMTLICIQTRKWKSDQLFDNYREGTIK